MRAISFKPRNHTPHLLVVVLLSTIITLFITSMEHVSGEPYSSEYFSEQARITALVYEALHERYNVNLANWGMGELVFAVKGIDNRISVFRDGTHEGDRVVMVYGRAPRQAIRRGMRDFQFYAIYHVTTGRVIDARLEWLSY